MATWLTPARARLRLDARLFQARSHLQAPSPASLEVETLPYPTTHPDAAVFEPMSDEYASVATRTRRFTPLTSSETLLSLVANADFQAANTLRKEMLAHHVPIPRKVLYLRAALHAMTQRCSPKLLSENERVDAFEAWLSLAPDRHQGWVSFRYIRQRLFSTMNHPDLPLVYRFGLVLARKGYYSGDAAKQVVTTIARCARPSDVETYLRQVEDAARDYHLQIGTDLPLDWLAGAYNLCIRTFALAGKDDAAFNLISVANLRGIHFSHFTLTLVAKNASDRQTFTDQIRDMYPSWMPPDTDVLPATVECNVEQTHDIAILAKHLRALRTALRSPSPPPPHALRRFMTSYQALGRTHALKLLRSLAYRHSPKSASTWALSEMLHRRSRREYIHLLYIFRQHFHPIGIPHQTLRSLLVGVEARQARKEHARQRVLGPAPMREKLWPSAYHTMLVWEALVALSPKAGKQRLYKLLLTLVQQSRQPDPDSGNPCARTQLAPDTYDAGHFSPFVASWARSGRPAQAAGVLRDMLDLGVDPTVVQWSMVARGYAQHDGPRVALGILDRITAREGPSDALLGIYTNVLRGFVIAGDVAHAHDVERRLVERLGYREGTRAQTDASLALLRELEGKAELGSE